MTRRMRFAVTAWPWVLAAVVLAPLLAPGYVLSYDMVFVPDLALRSDFLGLGTGLPRAVPSDAVVAVVDEVVPGMVLQKVVLVAAVVLAGVGARRLVPADDGVAQLAAASLYVWNPFVAERLGIGHWPLLLAYAALPWIFDTGRRVRTGEQHAFPRLVLWLALAALSAAGGLMAAVVALVAVVGRGPAAVRRTALVAAGALAVNAPWLVAGVLHGSGAVSDPAGVEAFAAQEEGLLPMPLAVLGLGGIWNAEVVPLSREGWAGAAALALTVTVCLLGWRRWQAWLPRRDRWGLVAVGAAGLVTAMAGTLVPTLLEWLVAQVPGAGLLRDGARFLAPLALLEASLFGVGAGVLAGLLRDRLATLALAAGAVLMPLALMPDLAWGLAGALHAVDYPEEYAEAREVLEDQATGDDGDLLVLPFTSYRLPSWNEGRPTLDPLGRYLPLNYVASDVLYVSGEAVAGEDRRVRRVEELLADGRSDGDGGAARRSAALREEGITWVATDLEARSLLDVPTAEPPLDGRVVFDGRMLRVMEVAGDVGSVRPADRTAVILLAVAWVGSSGLVVVCLVGLVLPAIRRRLKGP